MKGKMKKLLLAVLAVVAVLMYVPDLHAQSASANATVTADVNATLGFTKDTDVSFGGVQVGNSPILDPQGSGHSEVGAGALLQPPLRFSPSRLLQHWYDRTPGEMNRVSGTGG